MNNYNIQRLHIEQLILSCFLNQNRTLEMDKMEYEVFKLPCELFKSSRTARVIAETIGEMQEDKKPVDDNLVLCSIPKHKNININEYLEISCKLWMSFDTMLLYLDRLAKLDEEERKKEILKGLI